MNLWIMNCRQVSRLVSEGMDRQLSWRHRFGVRLHLLMCRHCARFRQQMQLLRSLLRREESLPENVKCLDADCKCRMQARLNQARQNLP